MSRYDPDQEHGSTGVSRKRTRVNHEDDIQNEDSDLKVCCCSGSVALLLHGSVALWLCGSLALWLISLNDDFFFRNKSFRSALLHLSTMGISI